MIGLSTHARQHTHLLWCVQCVCVCLYCVFLTIKQACAHARMRITHNHRNARHIYAVCFWRTRRRRTRRMCALCRRCSCKFKQMFSRGGGRTCGCAHLHRYAVPVLLQLTDDRTTADPCGARKHPFGARYISLYVICINLYNCTNYVHCACCSSDRNRTAVWFSGVRTRARLGVFFCCCYFRGT